MLVLKFLVLILLAGISVVIVLCGATWVWLSYEYIPNLIAPGPELSFDYIIVGAGTCGSVLAHELTYYSNLSVLLIEAGHLFSPISKVPLLAPFLQNSKNDWAFKSVPQKYSSFGLSNQIQSHPRGKGLGGSAQMNFMLHFGGNSKDFESWHKLGIQGWALKSSKKSNQYDSNSCSRTAWNNSLTCGMNERSSYVDTRNYSPIRILNNQTESNEFIWIVPRNYSCISEAFIEAQEIFQNDPLLFKLSKYRTRDGVRWSTYARFLKPSYGRSNLKILSNTIAKRIIIKGGQSKGVLVENINQPNRKFQIIAKKEIILSAGAFQSPQLLQVSGIGPKAILDDIGVRQIVSSKNVGSNLYDHLHLPLYVSINASASITVYKILNPREIFKYLTTGKGLFSNFGVIGEITSENDDSSVVMFATGSIDEKAFLDISNYQREVFRSVFPFYNNPSQEGLVLLTSCLQPKSRGIVKAQSSNIEDPPLIDPRYVHHSHDIKCIIQSVRNAAKIIQSAPFKRMNAKIHWPKLKACTKFGPLNRDFYTNNPSDKYLECLIRNIALTGHHPGGTCSMGSNPNAVVDNKLRVRGIKKLRVIDASVLPTPVSGKPNSILEAIGKQAAKLILKESL